MPHQQPIELVSPDNKFEYDYYFYFIDNHNSKFKCNING